jgi:hypothetical protein
MNKTYIAAVALGGAFLFTAVAASALQVSEIRRGTTIERQQELDNKRALRERIRATHEEYRALRKANDPRAAQAEQQLQSLKAEWQRLYGNSGQRDGRQKQMKQKRQKHSR